MPGGYVIHAQRSLVLSRGWGDLPDSVFLSHARALAADPNFHPGMSQLSDLRSANMQVTPAGVQAVARVNPFGPGAKRAFVTNNDFAFGMARMYEMRRPPDAGDAYYVCRSIEEACAWLGLTDDLAWIERELLGVPPLFNA